MKPSRNKLKKVATILGSAPRHHSAIKNGLRQIYDDIVLADSPIRSLSPLEFLGDRAEVAIRNFLTVDGNVSLEELVFLCALARKIEPRVVVEIGTFDGNTSYCLALNTPSDARIYTLDFPVGAEGATENDPHDHKYIASDRRVRRRFLGTDVEHKVIQCYGNSLTYDFAAFAAKGKPQLIFIDAGHSYECVRSDSEKSFSILDRGGYIVWQDYGTCWPGVYHYLVEAAQRIDLVHIAGTSLVVHRAPA